MEMQQAMQQMHRQMHAMQRQMHDQSLLMRQEMMQMSQRMQRDARRMQQESRRMQRAMQRDVRQQQRDASRHARLDAHVQLQPGAVSTSVINGAVYVNGQEVSRVPAGMGVNVQNINGVVVVNGQQVWPPHGAAGGHSMSPSAAFEEAMSSSAASICQANLREPCAICLAEVTAGQHTRTLPCFHMFHRSCAESFFQDKSTTGGQILCPLCRVPVANHVPDDDM
eukprot:TRINITY_DN110849_c0_g1_i1.p1 TRINITY_DN110849_c0_g1~~TRINITY_DN110849_c0_g1_i1.p1  ORF type:complete len:224 (-),score=52.30 TRINITY_DN110849_c0_g1_i1:122-793(-)